MYEEEKEYNVLKGQIPDFGYDAKISFTIDGKKANQAFPLKDDNYVGDSVECRDGVKAEWDNINWSLKNINSNNNELIRCTVNFKEKTKVNLATYLEEKAQDEGETEIITDDTNDHNIRYIGNDPNNYVWFNDELWRIIGVFNNQVKLVLNDSLGNVIYDISEDTWSSFKLQVFLNSAVTAKISEEAKKMVDLNHVWELGRLDGKNNYTTNNLYTSENNASTTWTGTTGLLYISDYGYAVDSTNRASCLKTSLSSWTENCYKNNWLFKGWMWYFNYNYSSSSATLITVPQVNGAGKLHDGAVYVYNISAVYPSIFLNNNVLYLTGSGTADDPILIESSN